MLEHGFSTEMILELIRHGLANAQAVRVMASGRAIEITRVRITGMGRRAPAERDK